MATARDSSLYTSQATNKYLQDARVRGGRIVPMKFAITLVSTAATGDTYNLFVLPANWAVAYCFVVVGTAMAASAGVNAVLEIGDSGDPDRYIDGLDVDAAQSTAHIAYAGIGYSTTADSTVLATFTGAIATAGTCAGYFLLIPPA